MSIYPFGPKMVLFDLKKVHLIGISLPQKVRFYDFIVVQKGPFIWSKSGPSLGPLRPTQGLLIWHFYLQKVHLFSPFRPTKVHLFCSFLPTNRSTFLILFVPTIINISGSIWFEKGPPNWYFSSTKGPFFAFIVVQKRSLYLVQMWTFTWSP